MKKKIIAAALSVVGLSCLGFAVACGEPTYYTLTYEAIDGVTLDFNGILSGAEVKEDYIVSFTYSQEDNILGDAVIKLNNEEIKPNDEGVYSFAMKGNSSITVTGVYKINNYTVTFDTSNNDFIHFISGNEEISEITAEVGDVVDFSVNVSVYYGENPEYTVLADQLILEPDKNGVYSVTVTQNTKIMVTGLELDTSFLERENSGSGTKDDPYLIERPIDLYVMADVINDDWYLGYYGQRYYKLMNDIDMKGERLYVIGDGTTDYAFFCGDFNGNGHTISNYTLKDTIIEQSEYTEEFINYIGLFGNVTANSSRSAAIYNLNLDGFTLTVSSAAKYKEQFWAGGLAARAIGASIYGCTVKGDIIIESADTSYFCYVGGITGSLQSAYQSETLKYTASVINCGSDVNIDGQSGLIYSIGGIVGYLYSADQKTPAYVVNCYAAGDVNGAMNAGGIVGRATSYSSIKNCYSYAENIDARNIYNGTYSEYKYAYAGGIVGYLESDTIVSNSYSSSSVYAASSTTGTQYRVTGDIVAYLASADSTEVLSQAAISFNNYSSKKNVAFSKDFALNTLGWSEDDWNFDGTKVTVKALTKAPAITVSVVAANSNLSNWSKTVSLNEYQTISNWYDDGKVNLNEYETANGLRSYGNYLKGADGNLVKIPYSYVLSGNETIYVGFADYSEVAGIYYINSSTSGSNIYFELDLDGTLKYVDGGLIYTTDYYYDGTTIYLSATPAFVETTSTTDSSTGSTTTSSYATSALATVSGGVLTATNNNSYVGNAAVTAIKKFVVDNVEFGYGNYIANDGTVYTFNTDGTGSASKGDANTAFTYTISGAKVTLSNSYTGTIESGEVKTLTSGSTSLSLKAYDIFAGTWEKSATSHKTYTFDGQGNWTYEYYGYSNGSKVQIETLNGTYVYDSANGKIVISNSSSVEVGSAVFNADGFIEVTYNGVAQTYYKQSSYVGTWRFAYKGDTVDLTINGISKQGYGTASLNYETLSSAVNVTYDVRTLNGTDYLYFFLDGEALGYLTFNATNSTLEGQFYSYKAEATVSAVFCLKDDFNGTWISSVFESIQFNGYGLYNLSGSTANNTLPVSGSVTINSRYKAVYTIDPATNKATFTFDGKEYTLIYNEQSNIIEVTEVEKNGDTVVSTKQFEMHTRDNWYGYTFVDGNNNTYAFNGGGTLAEGGSVTITATAGTTTKYIYKVEGDKTYVYSTEGVNLGEITISANSKYYIFIDAQLSISTRFTGEWTVGGVVSGENRDLVIGEIGIDGKAEGSYLGNAVVFNYSVSAGTISFVYGDTTYALRAVGTTAAAELFLSVQGSTSYVTCIKKGTADSFAGTYTAADGSYVMLDGLGGSEYGRGTAAQYDKDGTLVTLYNYTINDFGMVQLKTSTSATRILKPVTSSTEGAYVLGDKAYAIVTPDFLYGLTATDGNDESITYSFDGVGGIVASNGTTYTYTIETQSDDDSVNNVYHLTLKSGSDTFDSVFDYGSSDYTLTITKK